MQCICVCVCARACTYFAVHSTSTACALHWYVFQASFRPGRWGSHSPGIETKLKLEYHLIDESAGPAPIRPGLGREGEKDAADNGALGTHLSQASARPEWGPRQTVQARSAQTNQACARGKAPLCAASSSHSNPHMLNHICKPHLPTVWNRTAESDFNSFHQNFWRRICATFWKQIYAMQSCVCACVRARVYLFCHPLNQHSLCDTGMYSRPCFALVGGGSTRQGSKHSQCIGLERCGNAMYTFARNCEKHTH